MKKFTFLTVLAMIASFVLADSAFGQITQRGTRTTAANTGTTITISKPTGVVVGDVMIAVIANNDNDAGVLLNVNASLAGWTVIDGRQIGISGDDEWWGTVLYKVVTNPAEPASYAFAIDADSDGGIGSIVAFYGVDVNGGVNEAGAAGGPFELDPGIINGIADDNQMNAAAINPVTAGNAIVMVGITGNDPDLSNWSTATAGALTELFDDETANGADNTVGAAWRLQGTTGTTGAGTADINASDPNGSMLLSLKAYTVNAGPDQLISGTSVTLSGSTSAASPVYLWTKTSGPAGQTITSPGNSATTVTGLVAGTYVFRLQVNGGLFDEVTVRVITGSNLWATSSSGTQISSFSTNGGAAIAGPTNIFAASFPDASNTYTRTAALGRNASPSITSGYFYYLGTSDGGGENNGLVEVWGASAAGNGVARLGSLDLNGGSGTELGFVRLGMGPDGTGWILAGDGTTLYLAKFSSNALNPVTITVEDDNVALVNGIVADFVNGDICLDGSGKIAALANDGSGVTQVFVGLPAGSSTVLTKRWDLVDGSSNPFTGSVNGVAFENGTPTSGLYVSTSDGLYYINSTQASIPLGTLPISQVWAGTGLQDLASNSFPNTIVTPVKMTDFTVTKQGVNALLSWNTVTEINSDYFSIERSFDGVVFQAVGTVQAAGNSSSLIQYSFSDPIAGLSGIVYYRIRTVDIDGRAENSKIVPLKLNGGAIKDMTVFPNPFNADLKIMMNSEKDADVTIRISNAIGQVVVNRAVRVQKGDNVIVLSKELSALKPGMHFMEVISGDEKHTQKIIKR